MDETPTPNEELITHVAAMLQQRDYTVVVGAVEAGFELDILATIGQTKAQRRILVEAKSYSTLAGVRTIRAFAGVFQLLRNLGRVHEGWLVVTSGFTQNAEDEAERLGIRTFTVDELRRFLNVAPEQTQQVAATIRSRPRDRSKKRVFVVMPFDDAMIDVFTLGIAWVADRIGVAAQRADQIEHNGDIISVIHKAIREYDAVIADTTVHKPNVFYEVGYAHALGRPTILICNQAAELPFDIRGFNHVMYRNISHLREALEPRLRRTLGLP